MLEAIILAGGAGTRLRPVVSELPKPMAPIGGKPFLEILLFSLHQQGFHRVILSTGYMADKISSYFGSMYLGMQLEYIVESRPLGTGGAVKLAMTRCIQDHVYIFNGDSFIEIDIASIERQWLSYRKPIIVGAMVQNADRYGRLIVSGRTLVGFSEKGISGEGLINAGCYVFGATIFEKKSQENSFSLELDFFPDLIRLTEVEVFITSGKFIDIGVPKDYARAQNELAKYVVEK